MDDVTPMAGDMLVGAQAIADYFAWPDVDEKTAVRRVYTLSEKGTLPIWKEPGLGLVTRKSVLDSYFDQQAKKAIERCAIGA